jgi:hypothetical protein
MTAAVIPAAPSRRPARRHVVRGRAHHRTAPAVPVVRPRRRSERTYRRRRAAVGLLLAGVVGSAGLVAGNVLTGPGGVPASAAGAGTAPAERSVRVHAGDSLWSLAERFRGDVPITAYVEALISRNGGTRIEVGQVVLLP